MATPGSFPYPEAWTSVPQAYLKGKQQVFFSYLVDTIDYLTEIAKSKINSIRSQRSAMSIADMFDLQMAMNKLSQFSEMSTSIISAMNTSIGSMARNVKG